MFSSTPRKRVTVVASHEGIEKAEKALIRMGFNSKSNFATANKVARTAVTRFFNRDPIQVDTFKKICNDLKLKWEEILEPDSTFRVLKKNEVEQPRIAEGNASTVSQPKESMQADSRQVTVVNQQNEVETTIILQGDITSIDANFKTTLEVLLSSHAGCTIQVTDIQAGSIRITIKGDQQGIERLIEQFVAGELTDVDGFPVEDIHLLREELVEDFGNFNFWKKWSDIQEIVRNPKKNRHLRNVDLSDADLSGADLRGADLIRVNLSGADLIRVNLSGAYLGGANLSGVNLSGAYLGGANLIDANLIDADLSGANLSGANLSGANLSGAKVGNALFGEGLGLSNVERQHLVRRGAIFNDASGDREATYSPTRR